MENHQLQEIADGIFYCFALPQQEILPCQKFVESSRIFANGLFSIRIHNSENDFFATKIRLETTRDQIESEIIHDCNFSPDDVVISLLESCQETIFRDYHPDPNMHESVWIRHQWSQKGKRLANVLENIKSIPRVRTILETEPVQQLPAEPLSIGWIGWTGSSTDHALHRFIGDHLTSPESKSYDHDLAQSWIHAHEDYVNIESGRDFLKEGMKYTVVVLCWIFNPSNGYQKHYNGEYAMSPAHSKESWVQRLLSSQASYIFASGSETEVSGSFLGNLPGYHRTEVSPSITEYINGKILI